MSSPRSSYHSLVEERALEELRPRYESRGYRFVVHPSADDLPLFLDGYQPDAIAIGPLPNVAIEVIANHRGAEKAKIANVRARFEGQPDWKFNVVYGGGEPLAAGILPPAAKSAVFDQLRQAREILELGYTKPALLLGFSLLEATLHTRESDTYTRPRKPATVVQSLVMDGLVEAESETRLLALVATRNRAVHGDLSIEIVPADVRFLLNTIEAVLAG